jgi:hypothetical protein
MIKDGQVRTLFRLLDMGLPLAKAARKTDMDEKTARKYRRARQLPSERITPRWWRTRSDGFAEVWPEVEQRLAADPKLQAVTLFRWLQDRPEHQGKFADSQRRTFERRVRRWRATQGPGQVVMFAQVHHPGDVGAWDFRRAKGDILLFLLCSGPAAWMKARFQPQSIRCGMLPRLAAVGRAPLDALPQRCQLRFALRTVDPLQPVPSARNRTGMQHRRPLSALQRRRQGQKGAKGDILLSFRKTRPVARMEA